MPCQASTVDGFRWTDETNVFGAVAVTTAFLPELTAACPGWARG